MIIESVFQGKVPIRRIYLNGHVVWKPPAYLPPYLVYLNTEALTDQILTKMRLEQGHADTIDNPIGSKLHVGSAARVESGNMSIDDVAKTYVRGNAIGADLYLVNRDLSEEYASVTIQNIMNALHLEQIKGECTEKPKLFTDKHGMSLDTMVGSRISEESVHVQASIQALSARGTIFTHEMLVKILHECIATGLSSTGRIIEYTSIVNVLVSDSATGLGANGKPGDYSRLIKLLIDHNATGLGANGKLGSHFDIAKFILGHRATSLGANAELGDYSSIVNFIVDHSATGVEAKSESGDYTSLDTLLIDPDLVALAGKAELGNSSALLVTNIVTDESVESLDTKLLTVDREDQVPCDTDSHLTNLDVPMLDHEATFDAKYTADVNMHSVSAESVSFTRDGGVYDSELFAAKINIIGVNREAITKPTVDSSATLHTMIWLYPIQTGSDLYIPQVYDNGVTTGAVQNGSELLM